jgi:Tfp pilus assembly protein PilN
LKKSARPNRCNVLASSALGKHLWQFNADDGKTALAANLNLAADQPVPPALGAKSWTTLWQPSVNIAWLPADQVFLRVVQMPQADPAEIGSMLEFQLEKLSPLPTNQIVWSYEIIPSREINNVTVVVIIVERDIVEERIGALEQSGYQPDRLELPHIYQLVSEVPDTDGVWVYPWKEDGKDFCIAAWWFTGTMRNLQLIHLPATGDRAAVLKEQLLKTAWAGEMEGWIGFPIRWNLVAPPAESAEWEKMFGDWIEGEVAVQAQLPKDRLAQFAAARTVRGEAAANLLPSEFSVRYRQIFIDRLWMRGLFTLVGAYLAVVLVYFLAVQWQRVRTAKVNRQIASISQSYTNTLKMRERVQILQDQQTLKYAALDSLKAASDLLPIEVTLNSLVFGRGQSLELRGTSENAKALADYNDALRKATVNGQALFKNVSPPTSSARPGSGSLNWQFSCELNRQEVQ